MQIRSAHCLIRCDRKFSDYRCFFDFALSPYACLTRRSRTRSTTSEDCTEEVPRLDLRSPESADGRPSLLLRIAFIWAVVIIIARPTR